MPFYNVTIPYAVFVTVEVEAENEESAIEEGLNDSVINAYCGNGGNDKLIGVSEGSIEAGYSPLDEIGFDIFVEQTGE
jgi:hypothetical protein